MPWYDYQCGKCETVFEVQRPFGATGKVKCSKCGSTRTLKVFSPAVVQFKGSGFYVTDCKNGKNPTLAEPAPAPAETAKTVPAANNGSTPASPADGAGDAKSAGGVKSSKDAVKQSA